ncbi:MAG: hypothetical protein JKY50_00150 [Oleispira sp.]|nr:hypothetical protein [Oleispira sp.]
MAALLAAIGIILTIFQAGKRDQRKDQKVQDSKDYIETRKKVDNAIKDSPDNADDARKFLRDRNKD